MDRTAIGVSFVKMMPKILLCVLLSAGVVQCKPLKEYSLDLANLTETCAKQSQLDPQILKDLMRTGQMPPRSESYYNFLECLYEKQNYFDDEGFVSMPAIEKYLSKFYQSDDLAKALKPCEAIRSGSSLGERAYNVADCIVSNLLALEAEEEKKTTDTSAEKRTV